MATRPGATVSMKLLTLPAVPGLTTGCMSFSDVDKALLVVCQIPSNAELGEVDVEQSLRGERGGFTFSSLAVQTLSQPRPQRI